MSRLCLRVSDKVEDYLFSTFCPDSKRRPYIPGCPGKRRRPRPIDRHYQISLYLRAKDNHYHVFKKGQRK